MLLAGLYEKQERYEEAETLYKRTIDNNPDAFWAYTALGNLYQRRGNKDPARALYREADERRLHHTATALNYRRLKEIVRGRGIELVCVQYPLVPVNELVSMVGAQEGVTFIDNERVFKEAVRARSFDYYFIHTFPGREFGHCNPRGNRLLAENISRALIGGPLRGLAAPSSWEKLAARAEDFSPRRNLLADSSVVVRAVSLNSAGEETDRLIERKDETGRHVFLERFGEATQVRVDFGEGRSRALRAVASHHPQDPNHLVMEEHYFQGAAISGGSDGVSWRSVAPAAHREYPGEDGWRLWSFDQAGPFRIYEVRFPESKYSGGESYFRQVNELAFFE